MNRKLLQIFCTVLGLLVPPESLATCYHFTREHVDLLSVQWNAAGSILELMASDDDHGGIHYASNECAVLCPETMKFLLPSGTPLGYEGDPLWILPQNPYPDTPYVGVSAEAIPAGIFDGPFTIELKRMEGPGQFLLWQADAFGHFLVRMDTRDGTGTNDALTIPVGGHAHYNWGFTTSGTYRLYFQARGRRIGQTTPVLSPETPFTFHILPLRPFERWLTNHWPCECATHVLAPEADPDSDGIPNIFEYAFGNDPRLPLRTNLPECVLVATNDHTYGGLRYRLAIHATDLELKPVVTDTVSGANWVCLTNLVAISAGETVSAIVVRDFLPLSQAPNRFYQLRARLPAP